MAQLFVLHPGETCQYGMDFVDQFAPGEIVASVVGVTATEPAGVDPLTLADASFDGNTVVAVWVSGGTEGQLYTLTFTVLTSAGNTLVEYGDLLVTSEPI